MSISTTGTEELLRRYLSGALTAPEEAELERRALTDHGLREALAGYQLAPEADHEARIAAMVRRARPTAVRRSLFRRYAAAATVLVLLGIAALLLPRYFNGEEPAVAMEQFPVTVPEQEPAPGPLPEALAPPTAAAPALPRPDEAPAEARADVATAVEPEVTDAVVQPGEATEDRTAKRPAALAAAPTLPRAPSRVVRARVAPVSPPPPVRGRVTDEDGAPIVGAHITRPGMALGETTDSSGTFALPYDATLDQFTVTHPGYEEEEVELIDTSELLQISMVPLGNREAMERWFENAARQQIGMEPALAEKAQARAVGGLRALREKIEAGKPEAVPAGKVRVSFLVGRDGRLSDFQFRGRPDRATMDYVGGMLLDSEWEVVGGQATGEEPVRVYLKLRLE